MPGEKRGHKTFKPMETVEIKTVSAIASSKKAAAAKSKFTWLHTYADDEFTPEFNEKEIPSLLKNPFTKPGITGPTTANPTGLLPSRKKPNIQFKSASGDLDGKVTQPDYPSKSLPAISR